MINGNKQFLPFHEIKEEEVIVVDGLHPNALVLSHWKGANKHESIAADSSGEIVLNALRKDFMGLDKKYVSATHFDIDGFVGVFALFYPELAMQYEAELREMAKIGDFRELDLNARGADTALKLCCWMNKVEGAVFYRPFEEKDELEACVPKFEYFLKEFPAVLKDPEYFMDDWKEEYEAVLKGIKKIQKRKPIAQLNMLVQNVSAPIPYYALFSNTEGYDLILSIYPDQCYELEMKYTTWIDLASRPSLPRIDLQPLATKLNELEGSGYIWKVDKITDTGPILRLEKDRLSKAVRYANPTEREIYPSTIEEKLFEELVVDFLIKACDGIQAKRFWSWEEMRRINEQIGI